MQSRNKERANDYEAFLCAYGGIYEHSKWVAERAWQRGARAGDVRSINAVMQQVIDDAREDEKLALLRAHPDLAPLSEAREELTRASRAEQRGAGLASCTSEQAKTFADLTAAYRAKFGFPFILAVKGMQVDQILTIFRERLTADRDTEFARALDEVRTIALLRLLGMEAEANT